VAGVTYPELARREAELARSELARAERTRRFALRQADVGLRNHFLRVASRCEWESSDHAERARRFEALAVQYRDCDGRQAALEHVGLSE
jgi:hypothetical protein